MTLHRCTAACRSCTRQRRLERAADAIVAGACLVVFLAVRWAVMALGR